MLTQEEIDKVRLPLTVVACYLSPRPRCLVGIALVPEWAFFR